MYVCFLDYEKAFDKVRYQDLLEIMEEIGVDDKDLGLMKNLYWNIRAGVRVFCSKYSWLGRFPSTSV